MEQFTSQQLIEAVVCMLAIDGKIDELEMRFLQRLVSQLKIPASVISSALQQAAYHKDTVVIPQHPFTKRRLFSELVQAALANNVLVPEERDLLASVAKKMGLSQAEAQKHLWIYRQKNAERS